MVDTLVLGTSANAWEFESLHAQIIKHPMLGVFILGKLLELLWKDLLYLL